MWTVSSRRSDEGGSVVVWAEGDAPPETLILIWLTDCLFPVLLKIPVTLHPPSVANDIETPFLHLDFLGEHFGTTFLTLLQSFSKETNTVHVKTTFPHFTFPISTVSSFAREDVVTNRRRAKHRSFIFSKIQTLSWIFSPSLYLTTGHWPDRSAPRWQAKKRLTGGTLKRTFFFTPSGSFTEQMPLTFDSRHKLTQNYRLFENLIWWCWWKTLKPIFFVIFLSGAGHCWQQLPPLPSLIACRHCGGKSATHKSNNLYPRSPRKSNRQLHL